MKTEYLIQQSLETSKKLDVKTLIIIVLSVVAIFFIYKSLKYEN